MAKKRILVSGVETQMTGYESATHCAILGMMEGDWKLGNAGWGWKNGLFWLMLPEDWR